MSNDDVCLVIAVVTCSAQNGTNATLDVESVDFGENATYTCLDGYSLTDGNLTRECLADGYLDGTVPICSGKYGTELYRDTNNKNTVVT